MAYRCVHVAPSMPFPDSMPLLPRGCLLTHFPSPFYPPLTAYRQQHAYERRHFVCLITNGIGAKLKKKKSKELVESVLAILEEPA